MRIVMAGHRLVAPQSLSLCLIALLLGGISGCATKPVSYPWAKDTGTLKPAPVETATPAPATNPATTNTPDVVVTTPPASAPPTPALPVPAVAPAPASAPAGASEPAPPLLPATEIPRSQTSNGGEMLLPPVEIIKVEEPSRSILQFSATGTYMYGSVKGNLQIPRGGKRGSSNAEQPRFGSIGISTANIGDGELAVRWEKNNEVFIGAQIIDLDGSAFLGGRPLITDGVIFPPHARASSDVSLDWYRFGYRYTIPINTADNGIPDITFTPWAEGIVLDFNYHLTAPRVSPASRSITKPGVQIGATFAWRPNGGPLSFEASLGGFPNMKTVPTISVENLYARYRFYEWRRFDFTGLLGVAFEQQEYRDNQPLANHISAAFGPMLLAGLQVKF